MNDLQKTQLEMLRELDKVCRKLNISYFLVCGSALGAVKYGGFIPWDDDLDVAMYRDDYERFLEKGQALLPGGLFLQNFRTDPQFPQIYSKLRKDGTTFAEPAVRQLAMHQGVYLDIFPLDGCPAGRLARKKLEFSKRLLGSMLLSGCEIPRTPRSALLCRVWRLLGIHRHTARVAKRLDKVLRRYPVENSTWVCNHGNWQGSRDYAPKDWFGAGTRGVFEGMSVPLPQNCPAYLERKYGDITQTPPPPERRGHQPCRVDLTRDALRVVFVSNYYNHHQAPLCEALARQVDFTFLATGEMGPHRRELGYGEEEPAFVRHYAGNETECDRLIWEADAVLMGQAPEHLIRRRIRRGKLTFRYTERPLKQGFSWAKYLPRLLRWHWRNPVRKPVFLLCAGAYTAGDYRKFGLFPGKKYQWGYFPELRAYKDPVKNKDPRRILWAGRFLDWKHPDAAIRLARGLRDRGKDFSLVLLGTGELEEKLQSMVKEYGLEADVTLAGAVKPAQVREHMEKAGIYLATSDSREGWGAVVSEAMGSGCALVASHAMGAVPTLITHGENGLIYEDEATLLEQVCFLLDHPEAQQDLGRRAYETMQDTWNAETAAHRLLKLISALRAGEKHPRLWDSGPCSEAVCREERL